MNVLFRSLAIAGILAIFLGFGTSRAQAQYVNINVPGFSMSVGGGYPGYYSPYVPSVSVVAPSPVVVGTDLSDLRTLLRTPGLRRAPQLLLRCARTTATGWYRPYRGYWW